jgi:tRNA-splicing ligase RtcB (3'-phosphate/5'-hydroxy nucleic acid ligase)
MGEYASANHALIHKKVVRAIGAGVLAGVENHHNFAWLESHVIEGETRQVYVHRKGATPASRGVLGVIPGSMATPGFVVRGLGNPDSLHSASHGAGRAMSRTKAKEQFNWKMVRPKLEAAGVTLLAAGIDENPFAYKDIDAVMNAQTDLVQVIAKFDPKIVKMADDGTSED